MSKPLWSQTSGGIEYDDWGYFDSWDEFMREEPWNRNRIYGNIPTFWKVYHPDDPDYEEEYDTPSLGLVYTSIAPLRAYSIRVCLDPNEDQIKIEKWLVQHGFLVLGG
jgi:hypothetical protein